MEIDPIGRRQGGVCGVTSETKRSGLADLVPGPHGDNSWGVVVDILAHAVIDAGEQIAAPPGGNTGVQTPDDPGCALVDWFAVTFPDGVPVEFVLDWFGAGFSECEGGAHGYKKAWRRGEVLIASEGQPGMGVHVEASGRGCRQLEDLGVVAERGWPGLLADCLESGAKVSRLDGALDGGCARTGYHPGRC